MQTSSPALRTNGAPVRGLENVTALTSSICFIDGQQGDLVYRGYDIADLAAHVSFEDVAWLLWHGSLPKPSELSRLQEILCGKRQLSPTVMNLLRLTPEDANPMAVLRTTVSALAHFDREADESSRDANFRKALRLTARIPTAIAAFARLRCGLEPVAPLTSGSTARNFLYMLSGELPGPRAEQTMDAALVLHAEHGLNASTFAARVIGATLSDVYSAVTGAIGALKGPLHGGANTRVMQMLLDLRRSGEEPVAFVRRKLQAKERIMGFGHRVYRTIDPRASYLRGMLTSLGRERDAMYWVETCSELARAVKREKGIKPNVDFYSAPVYHMLGIDADLYTPLFVMSRITGWTAHLLEQWDNNRLIRPRAAYTGPRGLRVQAA